MDSISEKDISKILAGTSATVTAPTYWRKWKGRVVYIQAPSQIQRGGRRRLASRLPILVTPCGSICTWTSRSIPNERRAWQFPVQAIGDMQYVFAVRHDEVVADGSFILKAEPVCELPEL